MGASPREVSSMKRQASSIETPEPRRRSGLGAPRSPVPLGDRPPEPAELGHLLVDLVAVLVLVAAGQPLALLLRPALALAGVAARGDEVLLLGGEGEVHGAGRLMHRACAQVYGRTRIVHVCVVRH